MLLLQQRLHLRVLYIGDAHAGSESFRPGSESFRPRPPILDLDLYLLCALGVYSHAHKSRCLGSFCRHGVIIIINSTNTSINIIIISIITTVIIAITITITE